MLKELGLKNIITAIFIGGAVFALLVFSGLVKFGKNSDEARGRVVVWGTIPYQTMQPHVDASKTKTIDIVYQSKDPATFEEDLINAFASGTGPDLFIMPHEQILRNADKIFEIPYTSFPQTTYESMYIKESELFLTDTGILAIPVSVDPLVMYYNKYLLSSAFLLNVPKYWEELIPFVQKITLADANGSISISGASLGTYENILNAKGILSTLFLQNGNRIIGTDPMTTKKRSEISFSEETFKSGQQVLDFFTSFSRFGNQNYTWNEALSESREKFIAGELALYFGKSSEMERIRKKNPNLDFDVALIPQINETSRKVTYGSMMGIAISKHTKNVPAAIGAASNLTKAKVVEKLTRDLGVVPARKDLLANKPDDARRTLFYNSAIISDGWIDADGKATDALFQNMIRSINTGSLSISDALRRANSEMNVILNRTINTTIKDKSLEQ